MTKFPQPQFTGGRRDGAESELTAFSPVKERVIRRQILWLSISSAGVFCFGAASVVSILTMSPLIYVPIGWFVLSLILAFAARARIIDTFASERHKARADREDLIRRASARRGRLETVPDATMGRGYSPASGTVIPINGRRHPKEPLQ